MMRTQYFFLLVLISALIAACDTPTEGFERTNSSDPLSPTFRGGTVTGLQVSTDTSGIIMLQWVESDDIVTKNVLEKSLGDSLNFTPIAELDTDIVQYSDSTLEVRKDTYYRLSSFVELEGAEKVLYGSMQTKLEFGEISGEVFRFLNEENRLELSWRADVPFYTHFIISSENIISEQQENSIKLAAENIENSYEDPLLDIDFETRTYTINAIIEHNGVDEIITGKEVNYDVATFFQPENIEIKILNEQDWKVSWGGDAFFATEVEITRPNFEENVIFRFPLGTTSFIDSTIVGDYQNPRRNQSRKYEIRFLTDTGASEVITHVAEIEIWAPVIATSNRIQNEPNSLTIYGAGFGDNKDLIKGYIIEKEHPVVPEMFQEIARVYEGAWLEYTDTNVNESDDPVYRIRTITSYPSEPKKFTYSRDYKQDYSFNTGMNYVTSMEMSSDNRYLAAVSFRSDPGNSILVKDIELEQKASDITIPSQQITDIKISPDDSYIYFAVPSDAAIYRADFPSGENVEKIIDDTRMDLYSVYHINVSTDGSFLVGIGGRGFVKRWNLNTFDQEFAFAEYNSPTIYTYKNIAISPDGNVIGGNNGSNYMMDAQNGSILENLSWTSAHITDVQFSTDGNYYAFAEDFRSTHIFSTESWERTDRLDDGRRADFHPEKSRLVLAGREGVFTYDLETFSINDVISDLNGNRPYPGYENKIKYIDDDRIATVDRGGTIQIWKKKDDPRRWKHVN